MSQSSKQPPFFKISSGGIFGSVWREEEPVNGSTRTRFNARIEKRYRNEQGEWRSTGWYQPVDVADLIIVSVAILLVTRIKLRDFGGILDTLRMHTNARDGEGAAVSSR